MSKSAIFPIVGPFGRSKSRWNIITNVTVFAVQKKKKTSRLCAFVWVKQEEKEKINDFCVKATEQALKQDMKGNKKNALKRIR